MRSRTPRWKVPESGWLVVAFAANVIGLGWFALTLDAHWQQALGTAPPPLSTRRALRLLGTAALAFSLAACFFADHPTMAPLVWFMGLAAAAVLIAFVLAWRPRWLAILAPLRARGNRA